MDFGVSNRDVEDECSRSRSCAIGLRSATFAEAWALLAAVSLVDAWRRNWIHSKRRLNGSADSDATCPEQAA
ncbi:protein of unknown function [Nitrospira japonica]|uniref:Uncharacterized protein n=1 Tax=Nitrospira japonica TaxID=1325564 RepID=A0A1W1I4F3_9BACT|nr:protein of unknown function [Nitrospira japonica]